MKLAELLSVNTITTELKGQNKKQVIEELSALLESAGKISDKGAISRVVIKREELGSTGIGQGIAIPHAKTSEVTVQVAALGISRKGIAFDTLDGEPVFIVFLLVAPENAAGDHLKALSKISRLLKDRFFRQALRDAKDPADLLKIITEEDEY